jgi:predicted naringenin-chalcone synthase
MTYPDGPPRYINRIYIATPGVLLTNQTLLQRYEAALKALPLEEPDFETLRDTVRYYLMGERSRYTVPDAFELEHFASRARAFETQAEAALDALGDQILSSMGSSGGIVFDGIIATTSTGHLMPGLSYRMAHRLKGLVKPDGLLLDFGGVGCTGSVKALNLTRSLGPHLDNLLIVSAEFPTTLINMKSTDPDVWQGNCTFGDGAAALWVSSKPDRGTTALRLGALRYAYQADSGLDLIRWGYEAYYTFRLADEKTFERNVIDVVHDALKDAEPAWRDAPCWAIHPAGITLLLRLSRRLGLTREVLTPSAEHYKRYSNMSSASILHILKDIAGSAPEGTPINLLTMGAGFNVLYGQVIKER